LMGIKKGVPKTQKIPLKTKSYKAMKNYQKGIPLWHE